MAQTVAYRTQKLEVVGSDPSWYNVCHMLVPTSTEMWSDRSYSPSVSVERATPISPRLTANPPHPNRSSEL